MHYAVVIPVYNERELAPMLLERVLKQPPTHGKDGGPMRRTVVLVDDGSTDGTRDWLSKLATENREGVDVVLHERNQGKGAAVRTGFARALAIGGDLLIIQDADLEYDPADHDDVLRPIVDGRADAVIGSRFIGGTHRVLYFWHSVMNRGITTFSNMLTNLNLTDIECGFKAFSRASIEKITISEDRFGIEPEIVAKLARMRLADASGRPRHTRVYEVPVSYAGRTYEEGKKIGWKDGVRALWAIGKYRFVD